MSLWKKSMLYLGLGPDEAYDDFETGVRRAHEEPQVRAIDPRVHSAPEARPAAQHRPAPGRPQSTSGGPPRVPGREPAPLPEPSRVAPIDDGRPRLVAKPVATPMRRGSPVNPNEGHTVRALPLVGRSKPHVVAPSSFGEAQEIGDVFRRNEAVIVNLQSADRDLSRRLIDFVSGLCYGLNGQMERVAKQVYLITPADVEVSAEDRRELRAQGLYRD